MDPRILDRPATDGPLDPWILEPLAGLLSTRAENESLWRFTAPQLRAEFYRCLDVLGLQHLKAHLYSLRHGGASHDLLACRRSLAEVKSRGRWASDQSLKRYGKSTRMLAVTRSVPADVRRFGDHVIEHLSEVIQNQHYLGNLGVSIPRAARGDA